MRESDTVFLQTVGKFIQAQVQLAVTPLLQTINSQAETIIKLETNNEKLSKELDGAIEGFTAEISRIEKMLSETPQASNGKDGKDADMPALLQFIENYMKAIPIPKNGKDGLPGPPGPAGRDGADVVAAFRDSDGHLILTLSNGVTKDVGPIHGKDGLPGKNGKDGLGFKDMSVVWDGERTITFKFVLDERTEEVSITLPIVLFRGVWKSGQEYKQGDNVMCEGSSWIAIFDTDKQPGSGDHSVTGWVMSVRKGRDGKQGEKGEAGIGKPGKDGRDGRDLTQMTFDGKKY